MGAQKCHKFIVQCLLLDIGLMMSHYLSRRKALPLSPIKCAFIPIDNWDPKAWCYPSRSFPWHIWPCWFLCSPCGYSNWQKLGSKYGCLAMNVLWQPCLMNIFDIVFPFQNLGCECWFNSGNSLKGFFLFFFGNSIIPFLLLAFLLCNKRSFHMSASRMLVLSPSPIL
jgi:hypothetical protein